MNFEQISQIEREKIANWKKSLEDIYVLGQRYSKNIFEYQTSINLLKASAQMAITPFGHETLQLKTIPLFLSHLFLELIFMMESILLIIARVIMIPFRFLLSFNILNLMQDLCFLPMLFIAAFLHATLNLAILLISFITRPFATIFYLFSSSPTANSFQGRLHAIQDYINQSSLSMPEKHNALHIVECLIWLNTKKGQQLVIQNLHDQGNWLGTVFNLKLPNRAEIAIHFDRESKAIPPEQVVPSKVEIMTFMFCKAFEDLNETLAKNMFLGKLGQGACIEGRMEAALAFSRNFVQDGQLEFEDLINSLHQEALQTLGNSREIFIEDILACLFPKYSNKTCTPNDCWCLEGIINPENVSNYLTVILAYQNKPFRL